VTLEFEVTLQPPSPQTVNVDWSTANITAGSLDVVAAAGQLQFAPGETTRDIAVQIIGDRVVETDETLQVALASPSNARIVDGLGLGTILDDDVEPAPLLADGFESPP
jgi:chitinase